MEFKILANETTFHQVKTMAEACYDVRGDDSVVVLGYNNCSYDDFKRDGRRMIVYQLEQLCDYGSLWYNPKSAHRFVVQRTQNIQRWLTRADEIWDYDLDNIEFLRKLGFRNVRFRPMQYCEQLKFTSPPQEKIYDLLFFGTLNKRRATLLSYVRKTLPRANLKIIGTMPGNEARKYRLRIAPPVHGVELEREIMRARAVLNLHYYETRLQEQVRLFPLLINNVPVLSEKSRRNYFENMVTEFDGDLVRKAQNIIGGNTQKNIAMKFKFHKLKEYRVGAAYNTFYGLEQIERSIESIRSVVDEIVIVHQDVSFAGEKQSKETEDMIQKLKRKYHVITYHRLGSNREQVLLKRNAGLKYLKERGCQFIMPLDTDERYDAQLLRREIDLMWAKGIDTLYCPIRTFYFDERHYFDDTYYVPAVYRIDDRVFKKCSSAVLCDPLRKMTERQFRISQMPMLHFSYQRNAFEMKQSKISNIKYAEEYSKIKKHLANWREGEPALVFGNHPKTGELMLVERELALSADRLLV